MVERNSDEIVASEAFKVINYQIDQLVAELQWQANFVKQRMTDVSSFPPSIATRVSYEEGGRNAIPVTYSAHDLKSVEDSIKRILSAEAQIGDLMRLKLQLLNDWDFTHGDTATQTAIFG